MNWQRIGIALLVTPLSLLGQSKQPNPPNEAVRLVSFEDAPQFGVKHIVMRSKNGTYVFTCRFKAAGCITPIPGKAYWLVTSASPFGSLDMDFLKNWYVEYHDATNMGIVPAWKEWQEGWNKSKNYTDFMTQYRGVGVYAFVGFTAKK